MESNKRKNQGFDEPKANRLCVIKTERQSLKLADLNEDVLEKIFVYLNAQDLVNIVESDGVFLCSSRRAFKRQYKTKNIQLPIKEGCQTTKKCFMKNAQLLRYFGGSISKLKVIIYEDNPINRRIFHLIVTHCRETLTELNIWWPMNDLKINKSFTKLNTLIISHGYNLLIPRLHKWFPMLENLVFDCVDDVGELLNLSGKIASLKCLSLYFSNEDYEGRSFHIQDLHRFLQRNSQINELRLTLAAFNIGTDERRFPRTRLHDEIFPEELMTLKLKIPFDEDDFEHSNALAQLKIPNDRIAHLEVTADWFYAQICTYIAKCFNLKTLKVGVKAHLWDESDPFQTSGWIDCSKHELLTQLEIVITTFTYYKDLFSKIGLNAIQPYLKQSKNLITIKVRYVRTEENFETYVPAFDVIRSRIDHKIWSFTQEVAPKEISFTLKKITA